MSEPRDETHRVLAQADALMSRHRVFVAGAAAPVLPEPTSPTALDEDIPVLTEVVTDLDTPGLPSPDLFENLLTSQRHQLEQTVERWMDLRLPEEVLRIMDGISDQLIGTLVVRIRAELLPQLLTAMELPIEPCSGEEISDTPICPMPASARRSV